MLVSKHQLLWFISALNKHKALRSITLSSLEQVSIGFGKIPALRQNMSGTRLPLTQHSDVGAK